MLRLLTRAVQQNQLVTEPRLSRSGGQRLLPRAVSLGGPYGCTSEGRCAQASVWPLTSGARSSPSSGGGSNSTHPEARPAVPHIVRRLRGKRLRGKHGRRR